jgi:radical SAM superfamily enzyme with C-terminal helix-hairpin-helix motif
VTDLVVVDHGPRSLIVLPYPINPNNTSMAQWRSIPGIGNKRAVRIKAGGPISEIVQIEERLENTIPGWLKESISFKN